MAKQENLIGETTTVNVSDIGALEVVASYKKGKEILEKASATIITEGFDAADSTITFQGSNQEDKGYVTLLDSAGSDLIITIPTGDDSNAVYLPDFYFAYLKILITRNSSTTGSAEITLR